MPVHRNQPTRYRARIAPMGIPQHREQPQLQASSQASSDVYDHLRDLSLFEPSVPLIPAHMSDSQLTDTEEETLSARDRNTVDESNRSETRSQRERPLSQIDSNCST
jgi:hypothetical protein